MINIKDLVYLVKKISFLIYFVVEIIISVDGLTQWEKKSLKLLINDRSFKSYFVYN